MDEDTTVEELKEEVRKFCEERDWDQYHDPKELSLGILIEAGELAEHFRFKSGEEMEERLDGKEDEIRQELADVLFFILRFGQLHDIDIAASLEQKMAINREKYPVEKARGKNRKYTEYEE